MRSRWTVLATLALTLTLVAWIGSYWEIAYTLPSGPALAIRDGAIEWMPLSPTERRTGFSSGGFDGVRTKWGFDLAYSTRVIGRFPLWPLVLLFGGFLMYRALFHGPIVRRMRRRRGLCAACGYDLHGLLQPRCPECGEGFEVAD